MNISVGKKNTTVVFKKKDAKKKSTKQKEEKQKRKEKEGKKSVEEAEQRRKCFQCANFDIWGRRGIVVGCGAFFARNHLFNIKETISKALPSVTFDMDEITYIAYATDLSPSKLSLDEDESLEVIKLPIENIDNFITSQKVIDAKTILGLTLLKNKIH